MKMGKTLVELATEIERQRDNRVDYIAPTRQLAMRDDAVLGGLLGERLFPLASEVFYRRLALVLLVAVAIGSLIL